MKIIIAIALVALALFGIAARWYQVKDSLSIYLRPSRKKGNEPANDTDGPDT